MQVDVSAAAVLAQQNKLSAPPQVQGLQSPQKLALQNKKRKVAPDVRGLVSLRILFINENDVTEPPDLPGCPYFKIYG